MIHMRPKLVVLSHLCLNKISVDKQTKIKTTNKRVYCIGPRRQIPFNSDGIAHPPTGALLQNQTRFATHLEIRVVNRLGARRLKRQRTLTRDLYEWASITCQHAVRLAELN